MICASLYCNVLSQGDAGPTGAPGPKGDKVVTPLWYICVQHGIICLPQGHGGEKGAEGAVGDAGEPVS